MSALRPSLLALCRVAFAVALAGAVGFALAPSAGAPASFGDKLLHIFAFYVLAVLAALSAPRMRLLGVAAGLLGVGVAIELAQALPAIGRDCDWRDVVADMAGVGAALIPIALARLRGVLAA